MCFVLHKKALLLGHILRNGISGSRIYINSAGEQNTEVFSKDVGPVYIDPAVWYLTSSSSFPTLVTSHFVMGRYLIVFRHSFKCLYDQDC